MIYKGTSLVLVELREDFTPEQGFVVVERWAGQEADLRTKQQESATAGYITKWTKAEGVVELEISVPEPDRNPDGTTDEKISDDWQISTQFTEIDVWSDEHMRTYIRDAGITTFPYPATPEQVDAAIVTYKATCEDFRYKFYKADGKTVDTTRRGPTPKEHFKPKYADGTEITDATELGFLTAIYDQIAKGSDKSRAARISLVRRRTIAYGSTQRYAVSNVNKAWEPAQFYAKFGVPSTIQSLLPAAPAAADTPPGTKWAWALVVQDAETSGTGLRVQERMEWVFAPVREFTFLFNEA